MHSRWLPALVCGVLIGTAVPSFAQTVSVRVVRAEADAPLPGALVTLRTVDGALVLRALTDERGRLSVRAPSEGSFVVRADAIGYRGASSAPLVLEAAQVRELTFRLEAAPFEIRDLVVASNRAAVCDLESAGVGVTARLWDEARKALHGAAITRTDAPLLLDVQTYERRLSLQGRIERERRDARLTRNQRPFAAANPGDLHRNGWVQQQGAHAWYFGPDAELLLSDEFLEDHCFRAVSPDTAGHVGLAFSPHRRRDLPDIQGVLRLDSTTLELRSIDFGYANVDLPSEALIPGKVGGRIEFTRLPNGAWYVSHWNIRTPFLTRQMQHRGMVHKVVAYQDVGGEARPVRSEADRAETTVAGVVFDSLTNQPLAGVVVTLGGTMVDTTDAEGRYRLSTGGQGEYRLTFAHPRFAAVGMPRIEDSVRLVRGVDAARDIGLPSEATLFGRLCPADVGKRDVGILSAALVDAETGDPVPYAMVALHTIGVIRFRAVQSYNASGRLSTRISVRDGTTVREVTMGDEHAFYLCGVGRSDEIRMTVAAPGRASFESELETPRPPVEALVVRLP